MCVASKTGNCSKCVHCDVCRHKDEYLKVINSLYEAYRSYKEGYNIDFVEYKDPECKYFEDKNKVNNWSIKMPSFMNLVKDIEEQEDD